MLFSSKRPDGEARVLPHWHQRISLVDLRLRSNEARRPFAENPPGGGSFARDQRWLGRYSPLRGCSGLAALATAKILRRSTPRSFQTGSTRHPLIFIGLFLILLMPVSAALAATNAPPPIPNTPAREMKHPPSIPLWPNGAPGSEARKDEPEKVNWRQEPDIVFPVTSNIHNPSVTPYLPSKSKATGCAVIIAPGGGNWFLTMDREGYMVGQWLADHGIAAFVLKYRLSRDQSNPTNSPQPYKSSVHAFADAQRAMRLVRSRAQEWGVDPDRVGVMGFSAGGETIGYLLLNDAKGDPNAADPVDRLSARPDFAAHIYSAFLRNLATGASTDPAKLEALKGFPPTFLLCSATDSPGMVDFMPTFFLALKHAGVPAEMHVFNEGGHGFGVRKWSRSVGIWPELFEGWLKDRGFLQKK
jgi:acetyl esterase/lipase